MPDEKDKSQVPLAVEIEDKIPTPAEATEAELKPYLEMDELTTIKTARSLSSIASRARSIITRYQDEAGDINDAVALLEEHGHKNAVAILKPRNTQANKRIAEMQVTLKDAEYKLGLMKLARKMKLLAKKKAEEAVTETSTSKPA